MTTKGEGVTEEFATAAAFYERFPQHAQGYRSFDTLPGGGPPFGSHERHVCDSGGREWTAILVAASDVFRLGKERYRTERGHATGAVVAHRARDLHDQYPAVTRLLVDHVDLFDALACIYTDPRPSLEELTGALAGLGPKAGGRHHDEGTGHG